MNGSNGKPTIGVMNGDRNGIGSELVARLVGDPRVYERADLVVLGDPEVIAFGRRAAGTTVAGPARFIETHAPPGTAVGTGAVHANAGAEVLAHLAALLDLARSGDIGGIVFAPLNKNAMRLGGLRQGDELDFVVERLGFTGNRGELNVLGKLWTSRVTSHVPLRDVAGAINTESVYAAIALAHDTLRAAGFAAPRLGVAGLNPHAGDGGIFGDEEIVHIAPAVARARAKGMTIEGPLPSDTIFVAAQRGAYDAIVSMYHDQGQIAMKLMGFGSGVTVLGGLPIPIATAAHGTAYDIVGRGVADPNAFFAAFDLCCAMVRAKRTHAPLVGGTV